MESVFGLATTQLLVVRLFKLRLRPTCRTVRNPTNKWIWSPNSSSYLSTLVGLGHHRRQLPYSIHFSRWVIQYQWWITLSPTSFACSHGFKNRTRYRTVFFCNFRFNPVFWPVFRLLTGYWPVLGLLTGPD